MLVQQLYTRCLAQGAYYIQSEGEAAVIDPLREYKPYIDLAARDNATINYIFETHFHADFVSGHLDLAEKTGAHIVFGPNVHTHFKSISAHDGQEFKIGKLTLKVLHTPGHTLESTCYLLLDANRKPHCLFTGDTLFIGDVGRPDLAVKSDLTQEDLAGMLYDSLRHKIMPLPDDVIVYPAHGAGSACGKNMSQETFDTLGNQKKTNYALDLRLSKTDFVTALTSGIAPAPAYFPENVRLNQAGYTPYDTVSARGTKPLTPAEVTHLLNTTNALILDVRQPTEFADKHIPHAVFIGLDGSFAPWVGALIIDLAQPIVLVAPPGREAEAVMRLSRIGYDNCLGFLEGGLDLWEQQGYATTYLPSMTAAALAEKLKTTALNMLDVRKTSEYSMGHVEQASSHPLDDIATWQKNLPKEKTYVVYCAGGYRSMIAASLLRRQGFSQITNVEGGFESIQKTGTPIRVDITP